MAGFLVDRLKKCQFYFKKSPTEKNTCSAAVQMCFFFKNEIHPVIDCFLELHPRVFVLRVFQLMVYVCRKRFQTL